MSYHIHSTEAFIISSVPRGERNSSLLLLCEELGTLYAQATGVRVLQSKLRSHLIPHTLARVSLVRGKQEWHVVGAEGILRLDRLPHAPRASLLRVLKLATHTTVPDDPHTNHFALMREALAALTTASESSMPALELLTVLKIIAHAGFLPDDAQISPYVDMPLSQESAEKFDPLLVHGLSIANSALLRMQ